MLNKGTRDRILNYIEKTDLCSSSDIAKNLGINRITTTKYLSVMDEAGMINSKNIGMAKVWYASSSPIMHQLLSDEDNTLKGTLNLLGEGISVVDKNMRIIWFNFEKEKWAGKLKNHKNELCYVTHKCHVKDMKKCPAARAIKTGRIEKGCQKKYSKDGKIKKFEITSNPIKDRNNKIVGVISIAKEL